MDIKAIYTTVSSDMKHKHDVCPHCTLTDQSYRPRMTYCHRLVQSYPKAIEFTKVRDIVLLKDNTPNVVAYIYRCPLLSKYSLYLKSSKF